MAMQATRYTGPKTAEALYADKQKFWSGFTGATTGAVIFMVILLALMAAIVPAWFAWRRREQETAARLIANEEYRT